jgi:acetate kinase
MADILLVLNAGSSSLKFSAFLDRDPPEPQLHGVIEELLTRPRFRARDRKGVIAEKEWPEGGLSGHDGAIAFLFEWCRSGGALASHRISGIGHRVVHGGTRFSQPVRVCEETLAELEALTPLAPLHQPHNLAAIRAVSRMAPELRQVACFDTAFHRTQPELAQSFALPHRYTGEGVRRYGFHGLSYEYVASRLPSVDHRAALGRTVVAHLGNGASLCAMHAGRGVATTMSFTPLDGLVMGTRCGAIDPGVLLYLIDRHGLALQDLARLLYEESGLLGVSGVSSDMRELLASPDPRAAEAVDLFVYRIGRELGSMAAALGGLDALVFTGGIGENAAAIRERVCRGAAWLGLELDPGANASGGPRLSAPGSRVGAWVIPTDEELMIARHTRGVLAAR